MYRPWTTIVVQHYQEGPDHIKGKARVASIIGQGLIQEEIDLINKAQENQERGEHLLQFLMSRGFEPFQLVPESFNDQDQVPIVVHIWLMKRPDLVGLEKVSVEEVEEISERPVKSSEDVRPGE